MNRRALLRPLLFAGLLMPALRAMAATAQTGEPINRSLLSRLRQGGLIVFFRHSLTERTGQPDDDLSSCTGQRNLTEAGRLLATDIGLAIRALRIPVGEVLASPYCRCVDTAQLAFGRVTVAGFLETNGDIADPAEQRRVAQLMAALQRPGASGANTVLVAHGNNLGGLASRHGYPTLRIDEAEAVVFAPNPGGSAEVLGRIPGAGWRQLD